MAKTKKYKMKGKVWLYPGMSAWHFVNVGENQAKDIKKHFAFASRGFGSLPVIVMIGKTKWKTSIFPDKKLSTYVLPLKAEVRRKEGFKSDDIITFSVEIVV